MVRVWGGSFAVKHHYSHPYSMGSVRSWQLVQSINCTGRTRYSAFRVFLSGFDSSLLPIYAITTIRISRQMLWLDDVGVSSRYYLIFSFSDTSSTTFEVGYKSISFPCPSFCPTSIICFLLRSGCTILDCMIAFFCLWFRLGYRSSYVACCFIALSTLLSCHPFYPSLVLFPSRSTKISKVKTFVVSKSTLLHSYPPELTNPHLRL